MKDENIHKKLIDPAKRQVDLEHIIKKLNKNSKINNLVKDQWGEKQYEVRHILKIKLKKILLLLDWLDLSKNLKMM